VLHMLRFELGDELFWRALNRYITVNHFRSVETADLRTSLVYRLRVVVENPDEGLRQGMPVTVNVLP